MGRLQINKELSYLIGCYLGDGCCYEKNGNYQFSITCNDIDICQRCQQICIKHFSKEGKIKNVFNKKTNMYSYSQFIVCSKQVTNYLVDITKNRNLIPNDIIINKNIQKEFIRGIMDTDGCISKVNAKDGYIRYRVSFKNTKYFIYELKKLIELNNVKTGKVRSINFKKYSYYEFSINSKDYCKNINFNCNRKNNIAKECLDFYNKNSK